MNPASGSMASDVPVIRKEREEGKEAGVDTFAMYDLEQAEPVTVPRGIHVRSEMRQEGDMV